MASSVNLNIFFFLFCLKLTIFKFVSSQGVNSTYFYIHSRCSNDKHYDEGSKFQANLYYLISNLTSHSLSQKFYNYSTGEGADKAYGLFLCNSIADNWQCQNCIKTAAADIQELCPTSVEAVVWYTSCMFRYARRSIFSRNDVSKHYMYTDGPALYSQFDRKLSTSFLGLFHMATAGGTASATTTSVLTENILMNPEVDCTPDLSPSDCHSCLQTALQRFQTGGHQLSILVQPSCRLMNVYIDVESLIPKEPSKFYIGIGVISAFAAICMVVIVLLICCLKRMKNARRPTGLQEMESMESLHIEYDTIRTATYNFSDANKLGQGGFGIVYKGTLANGQAVAVKRLSNASRQGIKEFKTEACLAAKLQHKNLVKVYGFCSERDEMLLVYEFVPNKSLDRFLFDGKRGAYLKWETRYKIIMGTARGLLYLHEDSCPKIIHRDMKPSNILLDGELNPKIADFGMAKLFGGDQTQGNTSKIAGTFGYMAPEYATTGHFSVKSDIFSFGVLIMEIVSGSRNRCLHPDAQEEHLLRYAWRLWNEGEHFRLVDAALGEDYDRDQMERCIHVGLLCTQEDPAQRPNMASLLIMLNTQLNIEIPSPAYPPAFPHRQESPAIPHESRGIPIEEVITELSPR